MRTIDLLLDEYGQSHKNSLNKTIHWICIPIIMFSLVGILWSIPSPVFLNGWVTVGSMAILLALVYYIRLSFPLFLGFLVLTVLLIVGNKFLFEALHTDRVLMFLTSFVLFFLAWVGQFYGHHVEGKKPSFLKDLQFLLIGPAWLMHFIFKKVGIPY